MSATSHSTFGWEPLGAAAATSLMRWESIWAQYSVASPKKEDWRIVAGRRLTWALPGESSAAKRIFPGRMLRMTWSEEVWGRGGEEVADGGLDSDSFLVPGDDFALQ